MELEIKVSIVVCPVCGAFYNLHGERFAGFCPHVTIGHYNNNPNYVVEFKLTELGKRMLENKGK